MPKTGLFNNFLTVFRMIICSGWETVVICGDLFIDIVYNQASWSLQTSYLTQTSYEHLKFNDGACSTVFYLCLGQKSGWCPRPPPEPHPWGGGIATVVRLWVLPSPSAKHSISEHCSEAQVLASEFLGLGTWVSMALIWIHMPAIKHVQVQSLKCPSTVGRAVFQK